MSKIDRSDYLDGRFSNARSRAIGSALISRSLGHIDWDNSDSTIVPGETLVRSAFDCQPSESFSAGQMVFCEGDQAADIFSITSGQLKLYKTLPDGRRAVIGFLFPGEFMGICFHSRFLVSAESVTDLKMRRMSRRKFLEMANASAHFQSEISALVSRDLRNREEHILLLARLSAEERVARFLLDVYRRSGSCDEIVLPMNRIDIADYLGLTVETVSRMASALARKNLIISRHFGHSVKIVDVIGLSKIAQIDL